MNGGGHDFLAHPGFPGQKHRDGSGCDAVDQLEELPHRRGLHHQIAVGRVRGLLARLERPNVLGGHDHFAHSRISFSTRPLEALGAGELVNDQRGAPDENRDARWNRPFSVWR